MNVFKLLHQDSECCARRGRLELNHGTVQTPAFMPVGTNATVKAINLEDLEIMGINLILSNTYHLYLRPGIEVIDNSGGLHRFMAWPHNILTDSGGFQVFSLTKFSKVEEDGVAFRSHIDGSSHKLTPEKIIDLQMTFGSDILMPLDVCTPPQITRERALSALELTSRWAERSLKKWQEYSDPGILFGIIQGNFFNDLRRRSTEELLALKFPGYAIGGLSVGEDFSMFKDLLEFTAALIPGKYPRYLMGIGTPEYILEAVEQGIDIFDCVFPTRTARNAQAFTRLGPLSLKKEPNRLDNRPIDPDCSCSTCRKYTRAYLRHLFKAKEILAAMLTTHHNLYFLNNLLLLIRESIEKDNFRNFKRDFLNTYTNKEER